MGDEKENYSNCLIRLSFSLPQPHPIACFPNFLPLQPHFPHNLNLKGISTTESTIKFSLLFWVHVLFYNLLENYSSKEMRDERNLRRNSAKEFKRNAIKFQHEFFIKFEVVNFSRSERVECVILKNFSENFRSRNQMAPLRGS